MRSEVIATWIKICVVLFAYHKSQNVILVYDAREKNFMRTNSLHTEKYPDLDLQAIVRKEKEIIVIRNELGTTIFLSSVTRWNKKQHISVSMQYRNTIICGNKIQFYIANCNGHIAVWKRKSKQKLASCDKNSRGSVSIGAFLHFIKRNYELQGLYWHLRNHVHIIVTKMEISNDVTVMETIIKEIRKISLQEK